MARATSEASHLNIGTPKTSSYPEIVPEIEVEATRDSDEVCSLEKEECDQIMEHLKNNPGLVVKSLGSKGQTTHGQVMVRETTKPKPPTSKSTQKGFSKAADDSKWYHALEGQDCKALIFLLQANPYLVAQIGPEGWTVLHAAAYRGCEQLIDQVLGLFNGKDHFVDKKYSVKVDLQDLLEAKCGKFEAEAHDMAYFTCPTHVWMSLSILSDDRKMAFTHKPKLELDASQHLKDKIYEIMDMESSKEAFESFEEQYQSDKNYNFVLERKELKFHYACEISNMPGAYGYILTIIDACQEVEDLEDLEVLKYLLQLRNAQGQTPFHLNARVDDSPFLLVALPKDDALIGCFNAKDVRGWTALHYASATKNYELVYWLLDDARIDPNIRISYREKSFEDPTYPLHGMMALHLAILHEDLSAKTLIQCSRTDVNALFSRCIVSGYEETKLDSDSEEFEGSRMFWSPLQLATIMGLSDIVRALFTSKRCNIYDEKKLQNTKMKVELFEVEPFQKVPTLLLASTSGNPDVLRIFLDDEMFDPLVKCKGATTLHYATNAMPPTAIPNGGRIKKVSCLLFMTDLEKLSLDTCRYEDKWEGIKFAPPQYLGRKACITMLLQAGVDVWEKDNNKRLAEPGLEVPEDVQLWWHEQMARETLEAKKSLNDGANAISVVAALVATASFVGPLQPPLGYGGDSVDGGIQDTQLSIRVFMVSNILSFYLAIASIMFAVVPSLPMPQEGILAEWQRTRRSVSVAIFFLIMSVLGVLISFGAASNSVVSQGYSWQHAGLSFYPTLLGGCICILGISLLFLRLLRMVFNKNATIRYLYKRFDKF